MITNRVSNVLFETTQNSLTSVGGHENRAVYHTSGVYELLGSVMC